MYVRRCTYSTQASVEASEEAEADDRDAISRLWGVADDGSQVPLSQCDIAVVTYEALMDELRRVKRCESDPHIADVGVECQACSRHCEKGKWIVLQAAVATVGLLAALPGRGSACQQDKHTSRCSSV